jgi:hypothetical protein
LEETKVTATKFAAQNGGTKRDRSNYLLGNVTTHQYDFLGREIAGGRNGDAASIDKIGRE